VAERNLYLTSATKATEVFRAARAFGARLVELREESYTEFWRDGTPRSNYSIRSVVFEMCSQGEPENYEDVKRDCAALRKAGSEFGDFGWPVGSDGMYMVGDGNQ